MLPYWLLFSVTALVALAAANGRFRAGRVDFPVFWGFTYLVLVGMVGFRYRVGGDWHSYLHNLDLLRGATLLESLSYGDPAYQAVSWLFADFEAGIYLVNAACAAIFCYGLMKFCQALPRPWLALAAAVPYMIIVVAMGYTRQSVALGCWMVGLVALQRGSWIRFLGWVLLGAMFHKSAVILLPLPIILARHHRLLSTAGVLAAVALGYFSLLQDSIDELYAGYVEAAYQSEGALVRLLMSVVPAVILLLVRKRLRLAAPEMTIWRWLSLIAIGLFAALYISPSSTAVDRVALYLLPLQLFVFSYLPSVMAPRSKLPVVAAVLAYYAMVQFVWLNYAYHAIAWLPYRIYLGDGSV